MTQLARWCSSGLLIASVSVAVGCSANAEPQATLGFDLPGVVTTEYGDGASRATAYFAFTGKRAPVALRMTRYTVEGQPIYSSIQTQFGVAVFTLDERADGGRIRTDSLKDIAFVRYVPGRIVNGVEVAKERLEVADPSVVEQGGIYLLVEPACLTGACTRVF
ncbi:MAG TPA: hypothetical protein VK636_18685 [Gemmatimonadaceae bacterium]|nr:hypothetical protein [Gemmatimonadaceae bacterium]